MKNYLTLLLCLLLGNSLSAQLNLTYKSHVTYDETLNDVWGYVDPDGREYALVGLREGVSIIDITDTENPVLKGRANGPGSVWRDIKTFGTYAYVTSDEEGGIGLMVIDLSNLPNPITEDDYYHWAPELFGETLSTCHNIYIDEAGYGYLAGCDNIRGGGPLYIDLFTTPGTPIFVDAGPLEYSHDVYVRDNILYSSEIQVGLLSIYDVSDKSNTVQLASQSTPFNFAHNAWLSDDGNYIFTTDELPGAPVASYDISDLNNIEELDQFKPLETLGDGVIPHNVHVWENWLIISYYTDGCIIVDATRPNNLIEVGNFDTYLPPAGDGFRGVWGAYPFFPSGTVIATDIENGCYILEPNYVQACYLEGNVTDDATGLPIRNVDIEIVADELNESNTNNRGDYATGLVGGGTFNVIYSHPAYEPFDTTVTLDNGVLTLVDVQLTSLVPSHYINIEVVEAGTGNPVPNAKVYLEGFYLDYEVTTNANGVYMNLSVFEGDYSVNGSLWGYLIGNSMQTVNSTSTTLVIELEKGYRDEFLLDLGWQVESTASAGIWERGEPLGTNDPDGNPSNPDLDIPGDLGNFCYVTGNGGGSVANDDVDRGYTRLTSPVMDLSGYNKPTVKYYYWFYNDGTGTTPNDNFTARVNNGLETVDIQVVTTSNSIWQLIEINLNDFITSTDNMTITFECSDQINGNNNGHWTEAAVDVFRAYDANPTSTTEIEEPKVSLVAMPNPFNHSLTVDYQFEVIPEAATLKVYNVLGQAVESVLLDTGTCTAVINTIQQPGIYFLVVEADGQVTETLKVIKG